MGRPSYGAFAGYLGGWFDEVTMRVVDMVLATGRTHLVLRAAP